MATGPPESSWPGHHLPIHLDCCADWNLFSCPEQAPCAHFAATGLSSPADLMSLNSCPCLEFVHFLLRQLQSQEAAALLAPVTDCASCPWMMWEQSPEKRETREPSTKLSARKENWQLGSPGSPQGEGVWMLMRLVRVNMAGAAQMLLKFQVRKKNCLEVVH